MARIYRSAVDWWLALILAGVPAGLIASGVHRLLHEQKMGIFFLFEGVFVGGLMALFCVPCRYTLTDRQLHIRCGVMETAIPLAQIDRVEPSRSLWSAPALSLRRVRIDYGAEHAVISPRGREAFIIELRAAIARSKGAPART
jgi:hypothetical protein